MATNLALKTALLAVACLFFSQLELSAQCEGRYFWDSFTGVTETPDILYGNNIDYEGNSVDLYVDFFEPEGDTETERPLLLLAHGGFFVVGDRKAEDIRTICQDMARKGYACASMQYRLGVGLTEIDSIGFSKAVVRGVQDAKAAVRFFRKEYATYNIDTNQIFLGGTSAGGVLAVHYGYLSDTTILPEWIKGPINDLGGLEGNSGNPGYRSDIKGIVSFAGAIKDINWMANVDIPTASTHGTADNVVPYGYGLVTFALTPIITIPITPMYGSERVHQELDNRGVVNEFLSFDGVGHVPHLDGESGYSLEPTRYLQTKNFITDFLHRQLDCYEPLGLQDVRPEPVRAIPNPATSYVQFNLPEGQVTAQVYNVSGSLVRTQNGYGGNGFTINRGNLPAGMYMVHIYTDDDRRMLAKVTFE